MSSSRNTATNAPVNSRREFTICGACFASCSLMVEMENDRPVTVIGDKDNPVSSGYSCIKGRTMPQYHEMPSRLRTSMKRVRGAFEPISSDSAVKEIAAKIKSIIDEYGPRSVALYSGTASGTANYFSVSQAFVEALELTMVFNPGTIDQPGKQIAATLRGQWMAGSQHATPEDPYDVVLWIGINPIVSYVGVGGSGGGSAHNIVEAKKHGMKLIVIDPRKTETARYADLHMQSRPGEDPAILASIIYIVLQEKLYDQAFVSAETSGFDSLFAAVEPFTPEVVAARAGISAHSVIEAARTYAAAKKGSVTCGTGPNMAPFGTLTEYLACVLMTLCGHYPRAGDEIGHAGVLINPPPAIAATPGPMPAWGFGEKLRVHRLTNTAAGMPTAALPDEILAPGEGQVKALIVIGGNPMLAFPDQHKTHKAMQTLDLLVCVDPLLSATARLGHYVIAPPLSLEVPRVSALLEFLYGTGLLSPGFTMPYAQYTPAVLPKPAGSDLLDDWEFLFGIAREMGKPLTIKPLSQIMHPQEAQAHAQLLDMSRDYSHEELLEMVLAGSPVPLSEVIAKGPQGHVFNVPNRIVQAKPEGWTGKFNLADAVMVKELGEVAKGTTVELTAEFPLLLICRRMREYCNTSWHDLDEKKKKHSSNPAFMNPTDMEALKLLSGDVVEITSDVGSIYGLVAEARELRQGCVSMAHGWGVNPGEDEDPGMYGGSTSRLCSTDRDCDPYTWMARQSAIPVRVMKSTFQSNEL